MRFGRASAFRSGIASGVLLAVLSVGCGGAPAPVPDTVDPSVAADEIIVTATPGADEADLDDLFDDVDATVEDELSGLSAYLLAVDPSQRDDAVESLQDSPLIEGVLDNHFIETPTLPNDLDLAQQWHLVAIDAPAAWDRVVDSTQILVAVLDTGVDAAHGDLSAKLVDGANTFDGSGIWGDAIGHGTAVAGIVGAEPNGQEGTASVAWQHPILPVRVSNDRGQATSWSVAAGIALAVGEGADVINVSFAQLYKDEFVLRQAYLAWLSGSLVVMAADNTGEQVFAGGSEAVLFVGAVDEEDQLATFSTYGEFVDLVAPGVAIYTTKMGGGYSRFSGTSFSAPVVSGVAALVWSVRPDLRPATVQSILTTTADDLGEPGWDVRFGAGRVNALVAVQRAIEITEQDDGTAPIVSIEEPRDGSSVAGQVEVVVQADDDVGVTEVGLFVDGIKQASDAMGPYGFVLNVSSFPSGPHELTAVAFDSAGNSASETITLDFAAALDRTPPTVAFRSPAQGSTVRGVVTILADVGDDRHLALVEVSVDDEVILALAPANEQTVIAHNWDTSDPRVEAGEHTVAVRAWDGFGNEASESVRVTVAKFGSTARER